MSDVSRRDILGRGSALALGLLLGSQSLGNAEELPVPAFDDQEVPPTPVNVAVIGAGDRGKEILTSLSLLPGANITYVCDSYESPLFQKKALENAPKAKFVTDYKQVLSDNTVQGVFIATPSHQHKQLVLDAIAAGKAVYCEAPLASDLAEAKEIAMAGKGSAKIFQVGLQNRTNPQHHHVFKFVDTGAVGPNITRAQAQWNLKNSWRRTAPTGERENALNWRLRRASSAGLMGEIGIHQIDVANWFIKARPLSVSGFNSTTLWKDGRDVPDTVSCVFEYPNGIRLTYDATLSNSFGGTYELFQGDQSAMLLRGARAWMFKETDATALGWEVYARREQVGDDTGIMLVANASKLIAQGLSPADFAKPDPKRSPLYFACEAFLNAIRTGKPNEANAEIGYAATVTALKANEAVLSGNKITFSPEMFTL